MIDDLMSLLDKAAPLIYIVVPAVAAIWWNLRNKLSQKEKEVKQINQTKAKERYSTWEHEESKAIISKIKGFCNLYKDKGNVDLVQYLQLENGTVATSKIQNMFVTCLAEDDRYGKVPKLISKMQRMPYSECAVWLDTLQTSLSEGREVLGTPNLAEADHNRMTFEGIEGKIGSVIVAPVFDPTEILIGIVVFYYHDTDYNGNNKETEKSQILRFKDSIENIMFVYHQNREIKKKYYGVESA